MNEISPDQLLSQIRTMSRQLNAQPPAAPTTKVDGPGFGELMKSALDSVNEAQQTSAELKLGFQRGTGEASLAEVMIASEKAKLSFQAVTEVRNKLITAYQDIMNMPV